MTRLRSRFIGVAMAAMIMMLLALPSLATDNCTIPPHIYKTFTQGGWGGPSNSVPGGIRDANFANCFPSGLTVGGFYTIHLSTATDVKNYLPDGGTPAILTQNYVNPGGAGTNSRNLGSQLVALTLSMQFATCGVPGFAPLGGLRILNGIHSPTGAFSGWTVNQLVVLANYVLGGNNPNHLPAGISVSDLESAIEAINSNFDNGTVSNGYLVYPGCDDFLPVELSSLDAEPTSDAINVLWRTASETNVSRFDVLRRTGYESWQTIAHVNSLGNSASGNSYTYADNNVVRSVTYDYTLIAHENDGTQTAYSQIASARLNDVAAPTEFALLQNYPNPFNPSTTISYSLPEASNVKLAVFDLMGHQVALLASGKQTAGTHSVDFNAATLSTGVYFYRLEAGNSTAVRKLMLMK
jgi:hypothetical protein